MRARPTNALHASPKRVRVSHAAAAALLAALAGCDEPTREASDGLPLNRAPVPSLACREPVVNPGACARDDDCGRGQRCTHDISVVTADREPLSLVCGPALGTLTSRMRCSEGSECESGLCSLSGSCLEPCADTDDCQRGQACQPVEVRLGEGLSPVQACARVAAFPSDVTIEVLAERPLKRGVLNRLSLAGPGATSLVFLKAECGRTLRVQRIVDRASQRTLFDVERLLNGVVQINPSINEGALLPLLLPNNPRLTLDPRGHDIGVSVDADVDIQLIRVGRARRGTILDLNVFYVGGGSALDASGLHPGSAEFAEVLARLAERYRVIGLELGAVREYDVLGALRDELAVLEVKSERNDSGLLEQEVVNLGRLFELSAGVEDGGVNLFLVQRMGPLLGLSSGTPGALGLHGSALSGVALALDTTGLGRADKVLFHELGHQLGLFHTSELDGFEVEPLSDTAACSEEQDANGDGLLRSDECVDHGADNLMFWEGTGDALSPQQIDILTRALVLR